MKKDAKAKNTIIYYQGKTYVTIDSIWYKCIKLNFIYIIEKSMKNGQKLSNKPRVLTTDSKPRVLAQLVGCAKLT